jgi:hypothetical protein
MEGAADNIAQYQRPQVWPFTSAASAGDADATLLCAILAAGGLDEISTAEGAVERYVRCSGHVDEETQRLQSGVIFWVYPTGGKGPFEELGDGSVLKHGLLLTVERGALLGVVVRKAELFLPKEGIIHEHVRQDDLTGHRT